MPTYPATEPEQAPEFRCTFCARHLFQNELHRYACYPCEDRAKAHLAEMPQLYTDLDELLVPGRGGASGGKISVSKTAPIPAAMQPLNLRATGGMVTLLQDVEDSWRKALGRTKRTFAGSTEQALGIVVNFLQINLMRACEEYAEIADDLDAISNVYWQAKNTVEGTVPRRIPVTCRLLYGDGSECGARMLMDINKTSAKCGECGTRWGREEWVALYEATRSLAA